GDLDPAESAVTIDKLRPRDFGKVVILRGDPKNRHGADATLGHAFGKFHRGKRLVNCVERPAKEAGLLAGNHRDAIGLAQQFDVAQGLVAGAPATIHFFQRAAKRVTVRLVARQYLIAPRGQFVVMFDSLRIEASQLWSVAQVIEKEAA